MTTLILQSRVVHVVAIVDVYKSKQEDEIRRRVSKQTIRTTHQAPKLVLRSNHNSQGALN